MHRSSPVGTHRSPVPRWGALAVFFLVTGVGVAHAQSSDMQELRVSWPDATSPGEAGGSVRPLTVRERHRNVANPSRQRRPEVGAGQIIVTLVDAAGNETGRTIIPDPRILRAEFPDESGELQALEVGQQPIHSDAEFLVTLPDDPSVRELRVLEPRWNGTEFELDLVATVEIE